MFFTYWEDLGSTPARVNRYTGEIQINNRYFDNMPEFRKNFVIEHEKGHFNLDTRSEKTADKYAFNNLVGSAPRSLKESVYSISRVLSFKNPEHMERLLEMVKMALNHDYTVNGNTRAGDALNELNKLPKHQINIYPMKNSNSYYEPTYASRVDLDDDDYDNGAGKARRQAKKAGKQAEKDAKDASKQLKRDLKNDGKAAKNEIKLARADAKRTKASAKATKAASGDTTSWWDKTLGTVGDIFGKKSSDTTVTGAENFEITDPNAPAKLLGMPKGVAIAVIVLVVLGIIAGIFFAVRTKKS